MNTSSSSTFYRIVMCSLYALHAENTKSYHIFSLIPYPFL